MENNNKLITSWIEGNRKYVIYSYPLESAIEVTTDMISVFEFLGKRTPPFGAGKKVYDLAKHLGVNYTIKEISVPSYTGKVMLYERQFLHDNCQFLHDNINQLPGIEEVNKSAGNPIINNVIDDDDLPF